MRAILALFGLVLYAVGVLAQGLPFPGPSGGALTNIGLPKTIGTVESGTAGSSTYVITTSAAIIVSDTVIIDTAYDGSSTIAVASVTDAAGNSYVRCISATSGTTQAELWYSANSKAMSASSPISVTWASPLTGASPAIAALAMRVNGLKTSPLDQSASQAVATTTPSVTTGGLAQASELDATLAFAGGGTFTQAAGFTTINTANTNGTTIQAYQIISSTAAQTYAPTWSVPARQRTIICTFKGT